MPVPAWAIKRIEELAKSSGVSPERTLESALKMGLYAVKDQYAGLTEFHASADKLFFEGNYRIVEPSNEPLPVTRGTEETTDIPAPVVDIESFPEPERETEPEPEPEPEETIETGSFASALQ